MALTRQTLVVLAIACFTLWACKHRSAPSEISSTDASYIEPSRKPRVAPYLTEPAGEYVGAAWETKFRAKVPKTLQFLNELLVHLAEANPTLFEGWYSPDKFYFGVHSEAKFMDTNSRYNFISVSPLALLESSEVELLGVLAHEIAHITQRDHEMYRSHAGLEQDPVFGAEYIELYTRQWPFWASIEGHDWRFVDSLKAVSETFPASLQNEYENLRKTTWQRLYETSVYANQASPNKHQELMSPLQDQVSLHSFLSKLTTWNENVASQYKSPDVSQELKNILAKVSSMADEESDRLGFSDTESFEQNFMEERADNIGFMMFLNAGYAPDQFLTLFKRKLGSGLDQCLKQISRNEVPVRIQKESNHPTLCYQIYNISVVQTKRWKPKIGERQPKVAPTTISLEEVRLEIQRLIDNQ